MIPLKFYKVKEEPKDNVADFTCVLFLEDRKIIFFWLRYEDFLKGNFARFSYNELRDQHYENMKKNFNEVLSTEIETEDDDIFSLSVPVITEEFIKIYKELMPEEFI